MPIETRRGPLHRADGAGPLGMAESGWSYSTMNTPLSIFPMAQP